MEASRGVVRATVQSKHMSQRKARLCRKKSSLKATKEGLSSNLSVRILDATVELGPTTYARAT